MSYTLNSRQELAYQSLIRIFRRPKTVSATTGKVTFGAWYLVADNVPALLRYTQNDSDRSGIGRIKRRSALTEDRTKVPISVDLHDQDMTVDVTTPGAPNYGNVGRVQGEPRKRPTKGVIELDELVVQVMSVPANAVPAGVGTA
jgi:hypothetical protein